MRFPPAGWAWPPGPRVAAAHNSGVDGRRDGREKGPMQATSGPQRDKTLPARPARRPTRYKTLPASPKTPISAHFSHAGRTLYRFRHQQPEQGELYPACGATSGTKLSPLAASAGDTGRKLSRHTPPTGPPGIKLSQQAALAGPPGTKLSQRAPKRRFWPIFRMHGELCTASATNNPSRENFIPHAVPLPVQNSPSTPGSAAHPVQNSPSKPQNADFGPLFACRENFVPLPPPTRQAGRKKSRTNTPPQPANTPPQPSNVPLSKFRMQFDCVNFQQSPETLQFQRYEFKV